MRRRTSFPTLHCSAGICERDGISRRASITFLTRNLATPAALVWRKTLSIRMAEIFELRSVTDSNDQHVLTGKVEQRIALAKVFYAWRQFVPAPATLGLFHD